jgi:chromate transporter
MDRLSEVFAAFLRLGLTSFGGPVAHLGYFNAEFVRRRKWLDDETFAHVVALAQTLPGPASSQVAIIIGLQRAGLAGAAAAWVAFTLPSAILLTLFALGLGRVAGFENSGWIHGLLLAAVAVVALAVANMFRTLCPDVPRAAFAVAAAIAILLLPPHPLAQLVLIAAGATFGALILRSPGQLPRPLHIPIPRSVAVGCGIAFVALLVGLPPLARVVHAGVLDAFAAFYESGALVFGGGHVVLPLLDARVVGPGWISAQSFLAGYGAAQAVPGPLFTFAAYLGAAMHGPMTGIGGAAIALFAIYLPSFLLIAAVLPFWNRLVQYARVLAGLRGINAAVVGLLLAALYTPVSTNAIHAPPDAAIAVFAFMLLAVGKAPPWSVVAFCALAGQLLLARVG